MYSLSKRLFCLFLLWSAGLQARADGLPFTAKEVSLAVAGGTLYGTELLPQTGGKPPVVLIHAGSGPTDRNGNNTLLPAPNDSLKQLAEGLARLGIASLRFDKRGIAKSAAAMQSEAGLRFDDYVDDAAAWVKLLKADPAFSRVIVLGHSEGALIGMLAARQAGADAYVSIAGVARSADVVLRDQLHDKLPPGLADENERILTALQAGKPAGAVPATLNSLYRPSVQPYLISWFHYVPGKILATLAMPVLIIQGSADIQVGVAEARALAAAKPGARLVLIDGMNHVLKMVGQDPVLQQQSYVSNTLPVSPALLQAVANFAKHP